MTLLIVLVVLMARSTDLHIQTGQALLEGSAQYTSRQRTYITLYTFFDQDSNYGMYMTFSW